MAEPLISRIEDAIVAALQAITAPIVVPSVTRPVRRGEEMPPNYGIILTPKNGSPGTIDKPGNPPASSRIQNFEAFMVLRLVPAATEPFSAIGFRCLAAMAKALMTDTHWTVAGEQLAIFTNIDETQMVEGVDQTGPYDGVVMTFTVTYRVAENDWTVNTG